VVLSDFTKPSAKKISNLSRTLSRPLINMMSLGPYQRKRRKNSLRLNGRKLLHVVLSVKLVADGIPARLEVVIAEDEGVVVEEVGGVAVAVEGPSPVELQEKRTTRVLNLPQVTNVRGLWNQMGQLARASEETMHLLPSRQPRR